MRAFRVTAFDQPPALEETDSPRPGPGEVGLRIRACGLNFADLLMAEGKYQDMPALPLTLGLEVCGIVESLGPGVSTPAPGTRVAVVGGHGGLADRGVFPAAACVPVPEGMSDTVAAGFQIAYGTSHLALTRRGRLQKGETLVVLGAAGGVGLSAVEVGRALGARVIAVARGTERQSIARAAGADETLDAGADLKAGILALGGADVIYDPVGGASWRPVLSSLRPEGRYLAIGFASGDIPQIPANLLLVKNLDVIGFYWGAYRKFAPAVQAESLATLMHWHAEGRLRPHVSHVLPLTQAAEGLALLRGRTATGKVVVTP